MASSNPIIVGAGIGAGAPFVLNHLVYVAQASPPILSSIPAKVVTDTGVTVVSFPNSAGVYNAVTGATETVRIQGGMIVEGAGTDTVQIGRGASAATNHSIVIGATAADNGQVGIILGFGAALSLAGGIVIGHGATLTGNAGGAGGVVIGTSATGSLLSAGTCVVIGNGAVGHTSDIVIGYSASSSQSNAFGASNVVIGTQAHANIAQGTCTVVGTASFADVTLAVVIGGGSSVAITKGIVVGEGSSISNGGAGSITIGQGNAITAAANIFIGNGLSSSTPNLCWIGGPGTDIHAWILGAGDTIASPPQRILRFTNASGTNNAAGSLLIVPPVSTGSATSAPIIFQVGTPGGSSATLQTLVTVCTMNFDGLDTILRTYSEKRTTPAIAAGVLTLDLSTANTFRVALSSNVTTLTISNSAASGQVQSFTLILDVSGAFTVTWPASVHWAGGVAPTQSAAAGKTDIFSFVSTDGGTTWYGFTGGLTYVT